MNDFRSPISKARGLGSAKSGTAHFIAERATALALIPLSLWFIINLLGLIIGSDIMAITGWIKSPVNAAFLALFIFFAFWHSKLGVQVIIEDYIHAPFWRNSFLIINVASHILFGLFSLMAIFQLHFLTEVMPV